MWLVANELEDPFRNVPNDIPLNNFQAQYNEALVCMFAGFHPEAWWDVDDTKPADNSVELQLVAPHETAMRFNKKGNANNSSLRSINEFGTDSM